MKYGVFCRSNCTRCEPTTLMAFRCMNSCVYGWFRAAYRAASATPRSDRCRRLTGAVRHPGAELGSTAAVLVPSSFRYRYTRSSRCRRLVPCCGRRQPSSYRAASATAAPRSGRCRRQTGTARRACPLVTFRALLAFVSFSSGLPLDITI